MTGRTTPRDDRGLSLIEVLAAITLFGLIASGIATGSISTIRGNTASRDTTAGAALIHDKLEQLRALDPAVNQPDWNAGLHDDALNPMNEVGQRGGIFSRSWTVKRDSPRKGLAEVVVTVTWKDPVPRTLQAGSYLCLTPTCS